MCSKKVIAAVFVAIIVVNDLGGLEGKPNQLAALAVKIGTVARSFVCGPPQPRSVLYTDLFTPGDLKRTGILLSVYPRMVVLHRCDSGSGCCLQDGVCSPKTSEKVDIAFTIFSNNNNGVTVAATATNHTSCSCQAVKDLPK